MRKFLALLLIVCLIATLTACDFNPLSIFGGFDDNGKKHDKVNNEKVKGDKDKTKKDNNKQERKANRKTNKT